MAAKDAHASSFFSEASRICAELDTTAIERLALRLRDLRERGGRLFLLGVGGSAANASHAVNDFRKLCNIEAYSPSDNVAELTARTNDEGWEGVFSAWLATSRFREIDAILVLSVGGGDATLKVSVNLIQAVQHVKAAGGQVYGIVGRAGGFTAREGDEVVVVPEVNSAHVTPHTESFQSLILHCLVSHPSLQVTPTKW